MKNILLKKKFVASRVEGVTLSIKIKADKPGLKPAPVIIGQRDDIDVPEEDNDHGDKTLSND